MINSFKLKLLVGFVLILSLSGYVHWQSFKGMKQTTELVYKTYDQALMSGTFAQASKFDFARIDSLIKRTLRADTEKDFLNFQKQLERSFETLREDIQVVKERSLDEGSLPIIEEVQALLDGVVELKARLVDQKEKSIASNINSEEQLSDDWENNQFTKKLYRKLNSLYDNAAESGYLFRLKSEETNEKNLKILKIISILSSVLGLFLAIVLSFLIISPLKKLTKVTEAVDEGDYSQRSGVKSRDEFGVLSRSLNQMLDTIHRKDKSMETLLNSLPFGLFYFDKEGAISKERSPETDNVFENFSEHKTIFDFYEFYGEDRDSIASVLDATYSGMLPFESSVYLFPSQLSFDSDSNKKNKKVRLEFRPDYDSNDELLRIIMIATDITALEKEKLEKIRLNEKVKRIFSASGDKSGFARFTVEAKKLLASTLESMAGEIGKLKIGLHSLKGMLGVYSFDEVSALVHDVETKISEQNSDYFSSTQLKEDLEKISSLFKSQAFEVEEILGIGKGQITSSFNPKKVEVLQSLIMTDKDFSEIKTLARGLNQFPLNVVFHRYAKYVEELSESFPNKSFELEFSGDEEISFDEVESLDTIIMHIIKNSVDHGIEDEITRRDQGKNLCGKVMMSSKRYDNSTIEIIISDDGKGIDSEVLALKAIILGIYTEEEIAKMSEGEKMALIFSPGLTSKEEVSELSGRGVGMDAVKSKVEKLNGEIIVTSQTGIGTSFNIKIPII